VSAFEAATHEARNMAPQLHTSSAHGASVTVTNHLRLKARALAPVRRLLLPKLLALLLPVFWAAPMRAGEVRIEATTFEVQIHGGEGKNAWVLKYRRQAALAAEATPVLVTGAEGQAWFSQGDWVRLIDTRKGVVLGRWRVPGAISELKPFQGGVEVVFFDQNYRRRYTQKEQLKPDSPPSRLRWMPNNFMLLRTSREEPAVLVNNTTTDLTKIRELSLPDLERMAARDKFSPWLHVALGVALRRLNDPRAATVMDEALRIPTTDYMELLWISSYLEEMGERDAARAAYERGYADFIQKGNDPRLFTVLITRLVVFPARYEWDQLPMERRREIIERIYRLTPMGEGTQYAWPLYVEYLRKQGLEEEAGRWEERIRDRTRVGVEWGLSLGLWPDLGLLTMMSSVVGIALWFTVLFVRYQLQRRFDRAARERVLGPQPAVSLSWIKRLSRGDLAAYFFVAISVYLFMFLRWPPDALADSVAFKVFLGTFFLLPFTALYLMASYARLRKQLPDAAAQPDQPGEVSVFDFNRWDWRRWTAFMVVAVGGWILMHIPTRAPDLWWWLLGRIFVFPSSSISMAVLTVYLLFDWPRRRRTRKQARMPRRFRFLGMEYWTRQERIAFLTLASLGWYSAGLSTGMIAAILRVAAMPVSMSGGNLAGPVNLQYLEERLPASPERDLLLALAHQQSGNTEKAEQLYRQLPQLAESWNNLGALLHTTGHADEARRAYERALQMDPSMAEAALNLGRPAQSLWTELHKKYAPDQPMLVPPRAEQVQRAFFGITPGRFFLQALTGPFFASVQDDRVYEQLVRSGPTGPGYWLLRFPVILVLVLAITLVFIRPQEVTQPRGRWYHFFAALVPGTLRAWGYLRGGVVLVWSYFLLQAFCFWRVGTPYLLTGISVPNLSRNYGVGVDVASQFKGVGGPFNPGWVMVAVIPAALFLVNLALVILQKRREQAV
jgi:tetratricopeptide (TPR) repeat protein